MEPPAIQIKTVRVHNSAALTITVPEHNEPFYSAVVGAAEAECGIESVRPRKVVWWWPVSHIVLGGDTGSMVKMEGTSMWSSVVVGKR